MTKTPDSKYGIILGAIILVVIIVVACLTLYTPEKILLPADPHQGWNTSSSTEKGITFKYPKDLSTTYIHPVDWPPQVAVLNMPFACSEAGNENAVAGKTELHMVGMHAYCITKETGAAAGSTYTQYAYATPKGGKVVILTFSLQFPQCANYDELQKSACESEQQGFSIDPTIDQIMNTLTFGS